MKPILFSTPMIRAILALIKWMTRRVIKIEFLPGYSPAWTGYRPVFEYGYFFLAGSDGEPATKKVKCRYRPGDVLWVRETWYRHVCAENECIMDEYADCNGCMHTNEGICYAYKASHEEDLSVKWRPSIFMPREAARIFLRVKSVRVERVQEISEADVIAEGINVENAPLPENYPHLSGVDFESVKNWNLTFARFCYQQLWDKLNSKRGYGWDVNPWCWVIEFERITKEEAGK